jgi:hypothetical protein
VLVVCAIALALSPRAAAQDAGGVQPLDDSPVDFVEITPETRRAIERGLAYLASQQDSAGGYSADQPSQAIGVSSLAYLAFMADGNTPGRGVYEQNVRRGMAYILRNTQESGLIALDAGSPMYGHGYATLFLGEVYGMTGDPGVRDSLRKAVRLITISQNHEGGWRYNPVPVQADISVTICQIMALRSARNAGISVPKQTIDNAIKYVRACQNEDGGFSYQLNPRGSLFPRSAAGVASLYYAGVYQDDALKRGLDYLMVYRADKPTSNTPHYFYGQYYAVQATYLAGGRYWAEWYPAIRDKLLATQQADGSWASQHGNVYGTASALLVLQQPNRLLPIYQR